MSVSAESVARRVQRPLPYDFDMLAHLIVQRRAAERQLPELDPGVGQREAMQRAIDRIKRGEPDFRAPPDIDESAMLRDFHERQEQSRQLFDEIAHGSFLEAFWAARNDTLSPEVRAAAIQRLVPLLRPDKTARDNRLYPAAERRWRRELGETPSALLDREVTTAIYEAVATARDPRDDVFLRLSGKGEKYTYAQDGEPIVPAHDLREMDLRHALKAMVTRLVDREFQSEIADLKAVKAASKAPWAVETPDDDPQQLQARRVDLADRWASGNAQARDVLGANGSERTPRTRSANRKAQPETPIGVALVGDGAEVCLFCGRAADNHNGGHAFLSESGRSQTTPFGHVVDTDGHAFSVEALHGVGIKGLEALEAEERIRPQRAAKVEEIRQLTTPEQRRLVEAILATGYATHFDLAVHLGKRETAVRKLMFDLLAKVEAAGVEPPRWTRPPLPPREIRGGTVPAHVHVTVESDSWWREGLWRWSSSRPVRP